MELNNQQKQAVYNSYDKDVVLLASAGSGKTATLVQRVAYIINEGLAQTDEIMVLTFTNKAAGEMKERIEKQCGRLQGFTCGTFHSVFLKILKRYIHKLGKEKFSLIHKERSSVIKEILRASEIYFSSEEIYNYINDISALKNELIPPHLAKEQATTENEKFIARLYEVYQSVCWKDDLLDFDDLLIYSYLLLNKSKDLRTKFQNQYKYIIVDEAQDCNKAQIVLLKLLKSDHNNIMLIGDTDQSIYGFRGARPDYMIDHKKTFPNSKIMLLEQNYRSTQNIINASNDVIVNNNDRLEKKVFTTNPVGDRIHLLHNNTDQDEATRIVATIHTLINVNKYNYKDIAILYRRNALSREFESQLNSLGIPYTINKGTKFMERKEILNILCFFKFINNPKSKPDFLRAIQQIPGIGKTTAEYVEQCAKDSGNSYLETLLKAPVKKAHLLQEMYTICTSDCKTHELAKKIVEFTQIIPKLKKRIEGTRTPAEKDIDELENVYEFLKISLAHSELPIDEFLDELALNGTGEEVEIEDNNSIQLMSMHSSKGLEFPIVFLVGVEESIIPSNFARNEEQIADERRLMYVAMTRAKKRLYISSCHEREVYGVTRDMEQSRFVKEIKKERLYLV